MDEVDDTAKTERITKFEPTNDDGVERAEFGPARSKSIGEHLSELLPALVAGVPLIALVLAGVRSKYVLVPVFLLSGAALIWFGYRAGRKGKK
jgi:hypothetical protein